MNKITMRIRTLLVAGLVAGSLSAREASAQLCLQMNGAPLSVDFNGLAVSGANNTTMRIGFAFSEAGTGSNITYAASDGSSSTANTYSFGTGTNADRALGEVTGALQSTIGCCVTNNTGQPQQIWLIGYTGEEWRLGDPAAPVDKLDFQYSTNATSLNTGTWTNFDALDFSSPNNSAAAGPLNGNAAANRTVFQPTAINLPTPVAPGGVIFFRWVPQNIAGNNDGLAIDDFTVMVVQTQSSSCAGDTNNTNTVDVNDLLNVINHWGPCP